MKKTVVFEEVYKSPVVWVVSNGENLSVYMSFQNALDNYHLTIDRIVGRGFAFDSETKFDEGSLLTLLLDKNGNARKVELQYQYICDFPK